MSDLNSVLRMLGPNVSLDRAWAEFNDPRNRPTQQSTIEAIMYAVRERGVAALKEPATAARLQECDAAAREQIQLRIEKLHKEGRL